MLGKLRSRSWKEIRFRLGQEATNLRLLMFSPGLSGQAVQPPAAAMRPGAVAVWPQALPDPAGIVNRLKGTAFAAECVRRAEEVIQHRFPLLGGVLETGPEIRWRRDYTSGRETGVDYFRR